jgi:hypothetical protein
MNTTIKLALMNSCGAGICFMGAAHEMQLHNNFLAAINTVGVAVNIIGIWCAWPKLSAL